MNLPFNLSNPAHGLSKESTTDSLPKRKRRAVLPRDGASRPLDYLKLEPRRVLSVVGSFNAGSGVLDITLDADSDAATVSHDGTNLLLNGSKDIDPLTGGSQEVLLTDLKEININGNSLLSGLSVTLDSNFNAANGAALNALSITDVNTVSLEGAYEVTGDLVISLHGTSLIDDGSNGSLLVAGDSTFSLNDGDILLDNSTHDFQGVVKAETFGATDNDISLADANSIVLGDQAASGNLTVSAGGAISTDTVSSVNINVGKMVSLTADDGDALNANNNITFGGAGDSVLLGKLELNTADTATLSMSGNVELSGTSSAGDLFLDTTGELSGDLSSSLAVSGDLDLSANKIDLNDPANFTLTAGGLTFNSSGDVDLHIASAVTLKGNSGADNLVLVSTGAITNESGADLIVNNKASFSGSSIDLGDQTSDSLTFASLNFNSTGDVSIVADVAILLDGTMTADDLTLVATGNISNTAGIDLQVSGLTELQGSKISLGDTMTGENIQLTTLTVSGTDVSIEADSAVTLVGTNTANDLVLESSGAISNGANASLNVSGSAEFTGSSIHLGGQSGDSINVSKLTLNSAGAATYAADTDVHFVGSSHVKSLTLESTGTIDNATGASIEVDNALDITAQTSIDFGTAASDSLKVGTLTFSSPGDVAFGFESNVTLVNQSDANRLVLETTGSLDDVSNVMLLTVFGNASLKQTALIWETQPQIYNLAL